MTTINDKLAKILAIEDEAACAKKFEAFCQEYENHLPLPGENKQFDRAMWTASQFARLSGKDEKIVNKVVNKLVGSPAVDLSKAVLNLKELIGATKQAAIDTWCDMLTGMSWQQMVPAGATRGMGSQLVSLGTFAKQVDDINLQVNLGWHVDKDQLRLLMQAKNAADQAVSDVELRVTECDGAVVFSSKTDEDGAVVAPAVTVKPGQYKLQVLCSGNLVETPYFKI